MAFGNFTLTGHFDNLSGTAAATGSVVIDGNPQTITDPAGNAIRVGPRILALNQLGSFSITLPSNVTTGNSTTIAFSVRPILKGVAEVAPVAFYARAIGATVDFSALVNTAIVPLAPAGVSQVDFDAYVASHPALSTEAVQDLVAAMIVDGTNITHSYNDTAGTLTITASGTGGAGLDAEAVQDIVAAMIVDGANITHAYNDTAGTLTITASGSGGGLDVETVQDTVAAMLLAGANTGLSYNDTAGTLTVSASTDTEVVQDTVAAMLLPGTNMGLSYNDTAGTLTLNATGGTGGTAGVEVTSIPIAASDQPQTVKDAAVAAGGYACDGTADQTEINLAIDRAAALVARDPAAPAAAQQRGKVLLSGGRFNISAPIKMRTGTALEGAGYLTELRAVGNTGTGIITLATPDAHLTSVSHLYLYGNSTPGGSCDGINYDMTGSGNTGAYPDVNPDSYHFISHLYLDQFTGTAGTSRNAVKLWAGSTANNRGNMIDHLQIRDCNGNGVELNAASDSFIAECHVGGCAGSAYRIATGNTKISNCKSFYSDTYGLWVTSGRGIVSGFESQDDASGVFLDASPFVCSGVVIDTSRDSGMIVSSSSVVVTGLSAFLRGGGRYATMARGLLIDAAHAHINILGTITPAGITTSVSAPSGVGSDSFVRVATGTTLFSVG